MDVEVKVDGLRELRAQLMAIPDKLRRRALRTALAAGARVVRDQARALAPVLQAPVMRKGAVIRKPGTLRDAISVRTSKIARRAGNVGVFVNVRPLTKQKVSAFKAAAPAGMKSGKYNPNDPFYWRWLEFGRQGRPGQPERKRVGRLKIGGVVVLKGVRRRRALPAVGPIAPIRFLQRAVARLPDALKVFTAKLAPAIERINRKQTP